ncbi:hypothetical protein JL475_00510 [Streptomyces sp. M2CJ-2]|uniref:hypothetical protein n=1 Tax=Streptomyces sp. M2CJ-2 TaxID=2803948 RepID=UPI001922F3D0|nr:hypothetical protein [Streptomyces sp. M2CJ-2]MBL3664528.1 hypothetical protein [Streptomyces sp. M2CJ-2]
MYASVSDLEAWLAPEPAPDNAVRLLELASDAVDEVLYGVAYDPNDPDVREILRKAVVRQVHWLMDRGDETGSQDDMQSMSTGQRSFTRRTVGQGAGAAPKVGPKVASVLRTSGLLQVYPLVVG